ncbi:MAG: hypothetical protein KDE50_04990 [Caldilineaceae bacterium]|nr:hypothetical protein [Caldilineaceae bacterium]MCB0139246.1 hypothetical protein [Caldilineaceae bacterium]
MNQFQSHPDDRRTDQMGVRHFASQTEFLPAKVTALQAAELSPSIGATLRRSLPIIPF